MKKRLFITLMLIFALVGNLLAQQRTLTGTVTAKDDGTPLPGVTVVISGTQIGTVTDLNGKFSIDVPSSATSLRFSFVGMKSVTMPISNSGVMDLVMESQAREMEEVVVTALGISKEKKALGYSVTEVNGDEVSLAKETNVVNSLAGRVAGVVITKSTSGPGSGSRVIIRGNNSLNGNNQPLYVVDGIPIDNSGFGSAAGGGTGEYKRSDYGTGISDINPDDIESISVLKGPNAAALYGSRASNGVIIITTKKGTIQKGMGVTFSSNMTFEQPLLLPKYQNEYGQGSDGTVDSDLATLKGHGGSWGPKMDGSQELYWTGETRPYTAQPDNVKDFFRTGSNFVNTLALEGGNAKSTARFSYTNDQANSILENAGLKRHNFNLRATTKLSDKLSVDAKVTYFYQFANNRAAQGTEGIMSNLLTIPRNADINDYKAYKDPVSGSSVSHASLGSNPYWVLHEDVNKDTRSRMQGFVKATYELTDWLSAFVRVGTDMLSQKIETVNQAGHWFYNTGRFNYSNRSLSETNADFLLMLNKDLSSDLHLSANLGGNAMYHTFTAQSVYGENFKIPTKATTSSATILNPSYTPLEEKKINSLYGSASLSYKNFAYLDVSGRNDWSSTLPESNWSYFYPSASLSFLLQDFIDSNHNFLDYLKVRGSWAQVGGDTSPYQLEVAYNLQQDGYLGLTTLSKPSVKLNADLKPEQTKSLEFGAEFRMLKNRVYGDISYYSITSTDLIMDIPVAPATGYSRFRSNVGEMTNKGVEVLLGAVPVQTNNLRWDVSLNFSKNNNELVDLIEGVDNYTFSTTNNGIVRVQATVGSGFGDIYGTTFKKSADGRQVVDANGRPQATSEKVYLGNYQPDWVGGLTNSLSYKSLTLNVLVDARIGGQLFSGSDAGLDGSGVSERTLQYRDGGVVVDGVINTGTPEAPVYIENTNTITSQEYFGSLTGIAANYIYDQTNIRLREASLMWNLPKEWFDNMFLQDVTFGVVGRNLFFLYKKIDNFDPESSYSTSNFSQGFLFYNLPTTRSIGFNLNVKF